MSLPKWFDFEKLEAIVGTFFRMNQESGDKDDV